MSPRKKHLFWLLKGIGVLLFFVIIRTIDLNLLVRTVKDIHPVLFLLGFLFPFVVYIPKTYRWHTLVKTTGLRPSWHESWKLYNIGVFLSLITPAKLGELGRAGYLHAHGVPIATGVALSVLDRIADALMICIITIAALGILFSWHLALIAGLLVLLGLSIAFFLWQYTNRFSWMQFAHGLPRKTYLALLLHTTLGWICYFTWAILIAFSLGIALPIALLVSVFTLTGIVSLLPIAPSGFGTRDAVLVTLLVPYSVTPESAVALAFLMFTSILFSGVLGGYYWLTGLRPTAS